MQGEVTLFWKRSRILTLKELKKKEKPHQCWYKIMVKHSLLTGPVLSYNWVQMTVITLLIWFAKIVCESSSSPKKPWSAFNRDCMGLTSIHTEKSTPNKLQYRRETFAFAFLRLFVACDMSMKWLFMIQDSTGITIVIWISSRFLKSGLTFLYSGD